MTPASDILRLNASGEAYHCVVCLPSAGAYTSTKVPVGLSQSRPSEASSLCAMRKGTLP